MSATTLNIRLTPTLIFGASTTRVFLGQFFNFFDLGGRKTGGADDHGFARRGRLFEMLQRYLGMGKIDEDVTRR